MKKSIFSKSITILILALLLLAVFVPKELSQKLMIAFVLVWGGTLLLSRFFRLFKKIPDIREVFSFSKSIDSSSLPVADVEETGSTQVQTGSRNQTLTEDGDNQLMLRHISMRITEKIKSAYPDATWQWGSAPNLRAILNGETIRIVTDQMADFTHADISFDRYTRIHITPITTGTFGAAPEKGTPSKPEPEKESPVVDAAVWYDLIGRNLLTGIITDLNANGHTLLTIKENGDIVIKAHKKDVVRDTLENFPGKPYWNSLLSLLQEDELQGRISGDKIIVSWA